MSQNKVHIESPVHSQTNPSITRKNTKFERLLTFLGVREDENEDRVTEEERLRRYNLAMKGWKKVKKVLNIIRAQGAQKLMSKNVDREKKHWFTYENFLLMPNSKIKNFIITIKTLIMTYSFIIIPYRAFYQDFSKGWLIADYLIDPLLFFEIITNFFSAVNKRNKIQKNFSQIAHHYLITGFFVDILSIFPYYWVGDQYYPIRFFRFLQLFDTYKINQYFMENAFLAFTSNMKYIKSITGMINFAWLLFIIGQFLSCVWYVVGTTPLAPDDVDYETGGWIVQRLKTNSTDGNPTVYITSIYWVFTTLSTVGYGDIYGTLTDEYLFNMAVEFVGVFLFAYMLNKINTFIVQLEANNSETMEKNNEELDQWIMKIDRSNPNKQLPAEMVNEIKAFFRAYWEKDHTLIHTDDNFLNQLPRDLKGRLIEHLFSKFIAKFSAFFKGTEEAFSHETVISLFPMRFPKSTPIIQADEGAKNIYFITKGCILITSPDGTEKYVNLPTYSFFGDHLILFNLRSSNSFRTPDNSDVECMCLSRERFIELCEEFPESLKVLKYKAYQRRIFFKQVKAQYQVKYKSTKQSGSEVSISEQTKDISFLENLLNRELSAELNELKSFVGVKASPEETARLLEKSRKIRKTLSTIENTMNNMEEEFAKKIKNIKYYISFISNMEDLSVNTN